MPDLFQVNIQKMTLGADNEVPAFSFKVPGFGIGDQGEVEVEIKVERRMRLGLG